MFTRNGTGIVWKIILWLIFQPFLPILPDCMGSSSDGVKRITRQTPPMVASMVSSYPVSTTHSRGATTMAGHQRLGISLSPNGTPTNQSPFWKEIFDWVVPILDYGIKSATKNGTAMCGSLHLCDMGPLSISLKSRPHWRMQNLRIWFLLSFHGACWHTYLNGAEQNGRENPTTIGMDMVIAQHIKTTVAFENNWRQA